MPVFAEDIVHESFASHAVLSGVARRTPKQNDFLLCHNSDGVAEPSLRDVAVHFEVFLQSVLVTELNKVTTPAIRVLHLDVSA